MKSFMSKFIPAFYTVLFGGILFLLLFFTDAEYACKVTFGWSNGLLLAVTVTVFISLFYMYRKWCGFRKLLKWSEKNILFLCAALCVFQIFLAYQIYFETGWDAGGYILPAARQIAEGETKILSADYYSMYPNNTFLICFFAFIFRLSDIFGFFREEDWLMPIIVVNCMLSSLTCYLVFDVLKRLLGGMYAVIGYFMAVFLIGMSPWTTICYSDMLGLIFPVALLHIYLRKSISRKGWYLKYVFLFLVAYVGYQIKPQTVLCLFAIVLYEAARNYENRRNFRIKEHIGLFLMIVLSLGMMNFGLEGIYQKAGFAPRSEEAFGMTHFLMMGMNEESKGVWAEEDVAASKECKTKTERRQMNLSVVGQRLRGYGFLGYVRFLAKKMMTNYNDGTFAWSQEGGFYKKLRSCDSETAYFLRNIYYADGDYYVYFKTFVQGMWLFVLAGCFLAGFCKCSRWSGEKKYFTVIMLSLIGLTIFELLFEARARYLFTYVPVYIIAAVTGFREVITYVKCRKKAY